MWQGILQGLTLAEEERARREDREEARRVREEDMAFRREMFNSQILEERRTEALAVARERREQSRAVQEAINGAVGMGFDRRAAEALQASGQLGFVMRSMEAQEFSPQRIGAMSEEILRQLGDRATEDTIAAAVLGVAESGANLNNPRETSVAIAEALLDAEGIERIEELRGRLESQEGGSRLEPFQISLGTGQIDLPEVQRVRNQIMQRLQTLFGRDTFVVSANGDYNFAANAPPDVVNLVTSLTDKVVESSTILGPGQMNTVTAIQTFTNPIITAVNRGVMDVSAINTNLPTLFDQGPDAFINTVVTEMPETIPVPGVSEPADAMTAMTQRGGRQAGGVRPPAAAPQTGFGFDLNEELDR